jgi:hypothetical protein
MKNIRNFIIGFLLYHANRNYRTEYYYDLKKRILSDYGDLLKYKIQYLPGNECYSCNGTGIFEGTNWYVDLNNNTSKYKSWSAPCNRCFSGWYKRPQVVFLIQIKLSKYKFLIPINRVDTVLPINKVQRLYSHLIDVIDGYITHKYSKLGLLSFTILITLFDYKNIKSKLKEFITKELPY